MTIYIDNGKTVKVYPVKEKVGKAIMNLLEMNEMQKWWETYKEYGVAIVRKEESEED